MHPVGGIPLIRPLPPRYGLQEERARVAVIGLGNILFSDDGAGVHAAAELVRCYTFFPEIDVIDGGTMGLDLLPILQDRDRVLIIDAVDFGKNPGYAGVLEGDAIRCVLNPKLSVHHVGLSDLLLAAKLTRGKPLDVCLAGIQPGSLALNLGLTGQIRLGFKVMIDMVLEKLKQWNIRVSEPSSCTCSL